VGRRGRLLVFEGPEGAGKTTQLALLAEALLPFGAVRTVREPGGTILGDAVRALVLDPASDPGARAEALLFMASRAQLLDRVVRPALARGETVIADRLFLSTYAYQIAGRGLPAELVRTANQLAVDGLVPDLTILLTLPSAEGLKRASARGARDRMEAIGPDFHARVEAAFAEFATEAWQRAHPECGPIARVDARGSVPEVSSRVAETVRRTWPESSPLVRMSPEV